MKGYLSRGGIFIENLRPQVDCGQHRAKATVGESVRVSSDIFRDGPHLLQAVVRYRGPSDRRWREEPMRHLGNDAWVGRFQPTEIGRYGYTVVAWTDHFGTWRRDFAKRVEAGQQIDVELEEGARMIEARLAAAPATDRLVLKRALQAIRGEHGPGDLSDPRVEAALGEDLLEAMHRSPDRSDSVAFRPVLELNVDRERARFGAWYEFFPRSTGKSPKEHGTFATAQKRLPEIARMGFDVVYLPPIHPIGRTHRKGRNNALEAGRGDVGSPWAIGSSEGGHKSVHPALGTIEDFDSFVEEAGKLGLEVALDFAVQCSPDHPWVTEHPQWFKHRPDGSIRYAENPPKRYQDIYPIDFDTEDKEGLWQELRGVLEFWMAHGVRIFRVDNPHTKSFRFWQWVIEEIQKDNPDVIFLAEAFTRPKVMKALAKLGFTQSYTYFTWRNTKWELTEYMTELTRTDMADYFRPNFFTNTPDILTDYLQHGGPPAFKIRLVLAGLLSPTYGIYSGYELFENVAREPGSEEYLDSEKYQLRPRDFSGKRSLVSYITRINEIRRKNPALAELKNLHFHSADKNSIIVFSKSAPDQSSIVVVVNLNPHHWEEATVELDLGVLNLPEFTAYEMHDLITDTKYVWHGRWNYVRLDPDVEPAHVFRVGG